MTGRVAVFILLVAGCAAATPAAHRALGDFHAGHMAAHGAGYGHGSDDHAAIHARLHGALDELGLAADTRTKVEEVLRKHFEKALALMERLHSGEIGHDAAMAEHDEIVASATEELKPLLTTEQIQHLRDALHPQSHGAAGG